MGDNLILQKGVPVAAKYEIKKAKNGQFFFNLKAANGEVILTSEMYKQKEGADNGIESVKKNSPDDAMFERKIATNGQHYFVLKAANHEVIGKSETYSASSAMVKGIASVKRNAPGARVVDLTA
jgi:uncharacterized protein YegP (UPF0339 family)